MVAVARDDAGDVGAVTEAVVAVSAFGLTTADTRTRERRLVRDTVKSGSSPAMPVSTTATPTPAPVSWALREGRPMVSR